MSCPLFSLFSAAGPAASPAVARHTLDDVQVLLALRVDLLQMRAEGELLFKPEAEKANHRGVLHEVAL